MTLLALEPEVLVVVRIAGLDPDVTAGDFKFSFNVPNGVGIREGLIPELPQLINL